MSFRLVGLVLILSLFSGCAHLVAPLSEQPQDSWHGTRTWGAFIEDASIEHKVRVNLLRLLPGDSHPHIGVVSFNGIVLLTGQVESKKVKSQAETIAARIRHVRKVYNEIDIEGNISFLARTNDSWLTFKTKTRLLFSDNTPFKRTKVITKNGVIYLMGLLSHAEAKAVSLQAQKVYGAQRIVKVIEYTD